MRQLARYLAHADFTISECCLTVACFVMVLRISTWQLIIFVNTKFLSIFIALSMILNVVATFFSLDRGTSS